MMLLGNPQYFATFLKNSRAASSAVQSVRAGIKVAYFENRSTTTRIDPNSSDFSKAEMKSRETLSHSRPDGGRDQQPTWCLVFNLILLAHKTSLHITLHFISYLKPIIRRFNEF
ncbi:uncharacterized protein DS421_3g77870 [Arachis hypogaea]|nr:uncharacterized protein DS421_3g77870 [Arachis hypogaea]